MFQSATVKPLCQPVCPCPQAKEERKKEKRDPRPVPPDYTQPHTQARRPAVAPGTIDLGQTPQRDQGKGPSGWAGPARQETGWPSAGAILSSGATQTPHHPSQSALDTQDNLYLHRILERYGFSPRTQQQQQQQHKKIGT